MEQKPLQVKLNKTDKYSFEDVNNFVCMEIMTNRRNEAQGNKSLPVLSRDRTVSRTLKLAYVYRKNLGETGAIIQM